MKAHPIKILLSLWSIDTVSLPYNLSLATDSKWTSHLLGGVWVSLLASTKKKKKRHFALINNGHIMTEQQNYRKQFIIYMTRRETYTISYQLSSQTLGEDTSFIFHWQDVVCKTILICELHFYGISRFSCAQRGHKRLSRSYIKELSTL